MSSPFRTAEGGRIDRATTLEFTFDGRPHPGHPGDTLASALLAAGRHAVATSVTVGRPRDFALFVRSSSAGHLATWLLDAAIEYTATEYTATEYTPIEYTPPAQQGEQT